ncbi:MAG: hypothetical protein A4S09_11090 [Proteobacteria bacterium SG_bin7]|nr:MAG: hypothetical protein A4S09_11090 [Proteobacteria bacterium SG_bin7]
MHKIKEMKMIFVALVLMLNHRPSFASYSNYNSILIGNLAAGMGGAATALYEDASAIPFYNPAGLARVTGSNFSTSASVYHKYDVNYNDQGNLTDATRRINQGTFKAIPAVSSSTKAWGLFGLGFSVVFPDYDYFVGPVKAKNGNVSHLNYIDESLWVGGGIAFNFTPQSAVGLSMYYTARDFYRSVFDQQINSATDIVTVNEEKSLTHNDIVYILGLFHQYNDNWSIGMSFRFPSLEVSGRGSYFKMTTRTIPPGNAPESNSDMRSFTKIPTRLAVGTAYRDDKFVVSADVTLYGATSYYDLENQAYADHFVHLPVINYSLGMEYKYRKWLRIRAGIYTNYSSHPTPDPSDQHRQGDRIDMWGLSGNLAFYTSERTSWTFGGYYTGGRGESTQFINNQLQATTKAEQIFSMLIASSYFF